MGATRRKRQARRSLGGSPQLQALALSNAAFAAGVPATGTILGATSGSTIVATGAPAGLTIDGPARIWSWDGGGSVSAGSLSLTESLPSASNSSRISAIGWSVAAPPAPLPAGFALNGSTNTTLKSMLANVESGASRGLIAVKGDSTAAGFGAAITANGTSSSLAAQLDGARPYVPWKIIADLMTADGYPALNNSAVCDNGVAQNGESTSAFDPRLVLGSGTSITGGQAFAGGGFIVQDAAPSTFAPAEAVDTFVVYILNTSGAIGFTIDGSPASGITTSGGSVAGHVVTSPGGNNGFTRIVIPAGSLGTHTLGIFASVGTPVWQTVTAYDSAAKAIDIFNHASGSALSAHQASSGNGWQNNDFLAYQAPGLTVIYPGLNDAYAGAPTTNFEGALQAMIDTAKLSGDVLVLWSNSANPGTFSLTNQNLFCDAAAAKAAANGVAFGDIRAALGDWATGRLGDWATGRRPAHGRRTGSCIRTAVFTRLSRPTSGHASNTCARIDGPHRSHGALDDRPDHLLKLGLLGQGVGESGAPPVYPGDLTVRADRIQLALLYQAYASAVGDVT